MTEGYFLIAHCVNAIDYTSARVEWEIASLGIDGEWYTNDGQVVIPFFTQPIDQPTPAVPEGWIEHLHDLAHKQARAQPKVSLAETLGIKPKSLPPIVRRI